MSVDKVDYKPIKHQLPIIQFESNRLNQRVHNEQVVFFIFAFLKLNSIDITLRKMRRLIRCKTIGVSCKVKYFLLRFHSYLFFFVDILLKMKKTRGYPFSTDFQFGKLMLSNGIWTIEPARIIIIGLTYHSLMINIVVKLMDGCPLEQMSLIKLIKANDCKKVNAWAEQNPFIYHHRIWHWLSGHVSSIDSVIYLMTNEDLFSLSLSFSHPFRWHFRIGNRRMFHPRAIPFFSLIIVN